MPEQPVERKLAAIAGRSAVRQYPQDRDGGGRLGAARVVSTSGAMSLQH